MRPPPWWMRPSVKEEEVGPGQAWALRGELSWLIVLIRKD